MIKPQLCKYKKTLDNIELSEYIAERKYDGERIIAIKEGDNISLQRRSGKDATKQYPEIVNALKSFDYDIILDGEMCVFLGDKDDFQDGLSHRSHLKDENKIYIKSLETPAKYMVFDVLKGGLVDLREKSLYERKNHLHNFYFQSIQNKPSEEFISIVEYENDLEMLLEKAIQSQWEGIILKPIYSEYKENSRKYWIKIKITNDADLIFEEYEENNKGLKLIKRTVDERDDIILRTNEKEPITIQCNNKKQVKEVKSILDQDKEICITVQYLNLTTTNRLRMPVFKKIVRLNQTT